MRAGSEHKYLRVHTGRHDLPYYSEPFVSWQLSFYECFLKGNDTAGWLSGKEPKIKLAIREGSYEKMVEGDRAYRFRAENEWPLARTEYKRFNLTIDNAMSEAPSKPGQLSYAGLTGNGIFFSTPPAEKKWEICGHPWVKLSVSITNHKGGDVAPEIDVFLALRKYNKDGKEIMFSSSMGSPQAAASGFIRASHRAISDQPYPDVKGSDWPWPTLDHRRSTKQPVKNGEIYELQTEMWPTQLVISEGERLVLEVSPKDPEGTGFFAHNDERDRFEAKQGGTNTIHFGKAHENYVVLPLVLP
jgi:predicted acyl esterase